MLQNSPSQRGFSIAELLSVIAVLALIMSAVALIVGPLLRSQNQTQAKVDTVQAAAMALYRLERDLRNSDVDQIFVCTIGATPACTPPPSTLAVTPAIVMPSAFSNGTGQFQLQSTGRPNWQGATVYWVDASGNLNVAFDRNPGGFASPGPLSAAEARAAVIDVTGRGGMQLARFVEQLALGVPAGSEHEVSLQLEARSTVSGAVNNATYRTDVETRNSPS